MDPSYQDSDGTSMDLPPLDFDFSSFDLNSPWNLDTYSFETIDARGDGLDDLFEGNDMTLAAQTDAGFPSGIDQSQDGYSLNNFSSPPQHLNMGFPSAAATVYRDDYSNSSRTENHQGTARPARQGEIQAPELFATPTQNKLQHPAHWRPFTDAHQARIWLLKAQDGPSEASYQDNTIPRTTEQKRAVATRLRDAFETAEPARNKDQFLLIDWTCLELVDEVCVFHLYGPLTRRYLSGMPKHGPANFETYEDHINTLVEIFSTRDCPKAANLRKRMMDVTHRKRLIDNPLGELGVVQKNKVANAARKLKAQERKEKAARVEAAEVEVAELKARLSVQKSAGASPTGSSGNWYEGLGHQQSAPASRRFVTPSRPSTRRSHRPEATLEAAHARQGPNTLADPSVYPSSSFNNIAPQSSFNVEQNKRNATFKDIQSQLTRKRARHHDNKSKMFPQGSILNPYATSASTMSSLEGHHSTEAGHMHDPLGSGEVVED